LSTGLDYDPGNFAETKEIVELAKVVRKYGGVYATHTRYENSDWPTEDPEEVSYGRYYGPPENAWVGLYRGIEEAIEIGREANIPVHISHIPSVFMIPQPHPEFLEEAVAKATLWLIDKGKEEGIDITFDVVASADSLASRQKLIDAFYSKRVRGLDWVRQLSKEEFIKRIKTREFRERLRRIHDTGRLKLGMSHTKVDPYWFNNFRILECKHKEYEGKILGEIAKSRNADPLETIFDILSEDPDAIWSQFIDTRGTDIMNAVFLKHPAAMPCSDTIALPAEPKTGESVDTVSYGLFPHYFGHYMREKSVLTLEEAVKKATLLPAKRFGIGDRGILSSGAYADIVVFDFNRIKQKGDFLNPIQRPEGIEYVLVNGKLVYKDMKHTGEKPGKVLKHK
jgi:N-acyl-D-amino-acid deacylase